MKADKLYLVGFMGAGKTSVARALGRRIGWRVEDIDHRVEGREHKRVAEIFAKEGEPYFRNVERSVLLELLPERQVIVATGGGTFVDPENPSRVGILMDVPDMDAVTGAMETEGAAEAMAFDGVLPETLVILVER